ncbi:hypothetical protein EJ06DRAFT_558884 [Trichodelitschia bisporula]|uniref:Uncharacterized protein n=1 Tax=Trichodelitschia bisporula TaxID=703511 RepID=A0A6G1HNH3_9PEZI|nr:hypothetical protein EJ06DRAFT_558884 [Trichodelitschia bisporula]
MADDSEPTLVPLRRENNYQHMQAVASHLRPLGRARPTSKRASSPAACRAGRQRLCAQQHRGGCGCRSERPRARGRDQRCGVGWWVYLTSTTTLTLTVPKEGKLKRSVSKVAKFFKRVTRMQM